MAILVRGVIPEKSSHCSPLQPTLIWQFQSGGNSWKDLPLQPIVGNSWKLLPLQPISAHSYMAISVRGQFLKSLPFAINCSPLLHGNFSQGVISEKSSHCRALQPTPTWQFQPGGNSWKVLPLQPIAAHSYMAISVRGVIHEKSSHCSPLQPTLTLQFQSRGVIPEKSSHCSRLQPTFTWQFQSEGLFLKRPLITAHCSPLLHGNFSHLFLKSPPIAAHCSPPLHGNFCQGGNSSKVLPLQPIAAHSYMAILVRKVIPERSSHCRPLQPTLAWQFQSGGGG